MMYLDNAATTFKKPKSVLRCMVKYMKHQGGNPGRGSHALALKAANVLLSCREAAADLFGTLPERIALIPSATIALNTVIYGMLTPKDHVIINSFSHNAVVRPLHDLCAYSVCTSPCHAENLVRDNTKMLILTHASNVNGEIAPLDAYIAFCQKHNLLLAVDASQSAGHLPITANGIDFLICAGHKGLFGPQGTALLYVKNGILLPPLYRGGTGFMSESLSQPDLFPDSIESGTQNGVGFAGLTAGLQFIKHMDFKKADRLHFILKNGLNNIPKVTLHTPIDAPAVPVVSFNIRDVDCVAVSEYLSQKHKIYVRSGLHCAPLAHKNLGTLSCGTVRVSLSFFNSQKEIEKFVNIVDSTPCFGV